MSKDDRRPRLRRAAVLICVLVVLMLVGLLFTQTIQTLLIVRRSDTQRRELRQARELVRLGQMVTAARSIPKDGQVELLVEGHQATLSITTIEATNASEVSNEETKSQASAVSEGDLTPLDRYRIVATYATSQSKEVTASWESPK